MARLLTQHGFQLPISSLLQKASGTQMGSLPDGLETDAPAVGSMHGPFEDEEPAEVPPRCQRSQDNTEVASRS